MSPRGDPSPEGATGQASTTAAASDRRRPSPWTASARRLRAGGWPAAGQAARGPGKSGEQDREREGEQPVAQSDEGRRDLGSQEECESGGAAGEAGEKSGKHAEQAGERA